MSWEEGDDAARERGLARSAQLPQGGAASVQSDAYLGTVNMVVGQVQFVQLEGVEIGWGKGWVVECGIHQGIGPLGDGWVRKDEGRAGLGVGNTAWICTEG